MNVHKNLFVASRGLSKSHEKLSSGYRINTGADAPADLVISNQLRAQGFGVKVQRPVDWFHGQRPVD
jgi:flagellin